MRAKRSKKYRKLMHQYELAFGFREPYQVLVDSNFLLAVHAFKMDLIPSLERTLQGKVKPLLTKCSLTAIMASQPTNPRTNNPVRPNHLPPPTTLPLRHCSHNEDSEPIDEVKCLLSLLSPSSEAKKNKEHYILATADPLAMGGDKNKSAATTSGDIGGVSKKRKRGDGGDRQAEQELRRAKALRYGARAIPGVPIVYVKRSVMILEPMSAPSETVRDGVEKDKFSVGLKRDSSLGKRKREDDRNEDKGKKTKSGGLKKAKWPNPLSVKKPKKRVTDSVAVSASDTKVGEAREGVGSTNGGGNAEDSVSVANEKSAAPKTKRKRRHHKGVKQDEPEIDGAVKPRDGEGASVFTE